MAEKLHVNVEKVKMEKAVPRLNSPGQSATQAMFRSGVLSTDKCLARYALVPSSRQS
jgi:hypothetical protein